MRGKVISTGVLGVSSTSTTFSDKMGLKSPEGEREVFSEKLLSSWLGHPGPDVVKLMTFPNHQWSTCYLQKHQGWVPTPRGSTGGFRVFRSS